MNYKEWMERTSVSFKPRSTLLKKVDQAFKSYEQQLNSFTLKVLHDSFQSWVISKKGRDSKRNSNGAVDELAELIEKAMRINNQVQSKTTESHSLRNLVHGSDIFAEAARKARERTERQDKNYHRVSERFTEIITYVGGRCYNKWNATTGKWEPEVVPIGGTPVDREYALNVKLDLVLRGTQLNVKVYCAGGTGVTDEIKREWTKHILAGWNNRARLIDEDVKPPRKYDIHFSLEWVAPGPHVYDVGLGNPPPTVQQTGAALSLPPNPNVVYLSEVRNMALHAPDAAIFITTQLAGNIAWYNNGAWSPFATAANTPPLADLLTSLRSTAKFYVRNAKGTNLLGPFAANSFAMRQLIAGGLVTRHTQVRRAESFRFEKAGETVELKGFITPDSERKDWEHKRDTTVNAGVLGQYDRKAILHEFGHLIGNPDEYECTSFSANTGQSHVPAIHNVMAGATNSVMNCAPAMFIEERHFAFILLHFRRWQEVVRGHPVAARVELIKIDPEKSPYQNLNFGEALSMMLIRNRAPYMDEDEDEDEEDWDD